MTLQTLRIEQPTSLDAAMEEAYRRLRSPQHYQMYAVWQGNLLTSGKDDALVYYKVEKKETP